MQYERIKNYPIEEVLSKTLPENTRSANAYVDFDGIRVKMNSQRYNLFKEKGIICIECSIEGTYFGLDYSEHQNSYHFNLYAIGENGNEVLMTKDHIVPKSKGGKNKIENYQTMCFPCNYEKGDNI